MKAKSVTGGAMMMTMMLLMMFVDKERKEGREKNRMTLFFFAVAFVTKNTYTVGLCTESQKLPPRKRRWQYFITLPALIINYGWAKIFFLFFFFSSFLPLRPLSTSLPTFQRALPPPPPLLLLPSIIKTAFSLAVLSIVR